MARSHPSKDLAAWNLVAALGIFFCSWPRADSAEGDWPQYRGNQANGVDARAEVPTHWDLKTGENIAWQTEIPGLGCSAPNQERMKEARVAGLTASPVSDGKHLFLPSEEGKVVVVPANGEYSISEINDLGEACFATPALSDGMLLLRTHHKLIAVKKKTPTTDTR